MTISPSDPFATPAEQRSPVRRLRGRLASAVTLWTAYDGAHRPAGLAVSSTLVVDGEPGRLLGVLDDESDLWAAVEESGRFAVTVLAPADRQLADKVAGLMPAPGGVFAGDGWRDAGYGPVPAGRSTVAGCRLDAGRPVCWGVRVEATVERIDLGEPEPPLIHHRGRYRELA